ncbi:delta 1-pyrroline-5-carboxylate reductase [Basidiobolus meristosporus CBS 931.73]|uniref:Delta 1-pyrroline-5-carboxylate reductase n=1 Tax=Basidiobolus meristosporus CBS 931.73 TaxID=1314790 RepID=A0A1Y1Y2Z6_9FUNG|nr:delta 1-pyrroline-5-carboxylate reductase [Basidiobolus meristosporus CBS 931.73]|eukprot:ORX92370.1 delta 1-pyrroline-5-carboxylate reductase [Basidiobolus meristosporus CBS 931.73]
MSSINQERIAFIGGGNMAEAIIGGLIANKYAPQCITVFDPSEERQVELHKKYGITVAPDGNSAIYGVEENGDHSAEIVVLAVKPQVLKQVAFGLSKAIRTVQPLVVSIAAGIRTQSMERWLLTGNEDGNLSDSDDEAKISIVRCMPNTPALVLCGASGMYANRNVSASQKESADKVMSAVSKTEWVEKEDLLDAVTAVSGSGPAYFFLVLEAMEKAGVEAGLSAETASALAIQTCLGAAKMAADSDDSVAELRRKVTSPNGTTDAAIKTMIKGDVPKWVSNGVIAADKKSKELAKELGN